MQLKDWIEDREIEVATFARQIKLSRQIVYKYMESTIPSIPVAMRIAEATDGEVSLEDWADTVRERAEEKAEGSEKTLDNTPTFW